MGLFAYCMWKSLLFFPRVSCDRALHSVEPSAAETFSDSPFLHLHTTVSLTESLRIVKPILWLKNHSFKTLVKMVLSLPSLRVHSICCPFTDHLLGVRRQPFSCV